MIDPLFSDYINMILSSLKNRLGDALVSVVLFGSVARGEADEGSDIDLLVVSKHFDEHYGDRFLLFNEVERELLNSEPRRRLRRSGFGTLISPVPLTPEEVGRNPPILLDILTDGIIQHDKGDFIKGRLAELERKLRTLKARKVRLPSGGWYWNLKPDYKLGEVVEI